MLCTLVVAVASVMYVILESPSLVKPSQTIFQIVEKGSSKTSFVLAKMQSDSLVLNFDCFLSILVITQQT
jgi:hypothetical protein